MSNAPDDEISPELREAVTALRRMKRTARTELREGIPRGQSTGAPREEETPVMGSTPDGKIQ
jgi:hypothetical protein